MKRSVRTALSLVLAVVFAVSTFQLYDYYKSFSQAEESQTTALEAMNPAVPVEELTEKTETPLRESPEWEDKEEAAPEKEIDEQTAAMLSIDLEVLRTTNPDVLGWIEIPGTVISYPLMQAENNQQYLYTTWDKKSSKFGSIFLECRSSRDLSDFNTIVYGHNMLTEDMFGTLLRYGEQSYFKAHPSIYIRTDDGVRRYDIFSAYEADVVSDTYRLIFEDDARRQSALDLYMSASVLETGLTPSVRDRILTLSTCTGRGTDDLRFVVQAVLTEYTEKAGS